MRLREHLEMSADSCSGRFDVSQFCGIFTTDVQNTSNNQNQTNVIDPCGQNCVTINE